MNDSRRRPPPIGPEDPFQVIARSRYRPGGIAAVVIFLALPFVAAIIGMRPYEEAARSTRDPIILQLAQLNGLILGGIVYVAVVGWLICVRLERIFEAIPKRERRLEKPPVAKRP